MPGPGTLRKSLPTAIRKREGQTRRRGVSSDLNSPDVFKSPKGSYRKTSVNMEKLTKTKIGTAGPTGKTATSSVVRSPIRRGRGPSSQAQARAEAIGRSIGKRS